MTLKPRSMSSFHEQLAESTQKRSQHSESAIYFANGNVDIWKQPCGNKLNVDENISIGAEYFSVNCSDRLAWTPALQVETSIYGVVSMFHEKQGL